MRCKSYGTSYLLLILGPLLVRGANEAKPLPWADSGNLVSQILNSLNATMPSTPPLPFGLQSTIDSAVSAVNQVTGGIVKFVNAPNLVKGLVEDFLNQQEDALDATIIAIDTTLLNPLEFQINQVVKGYAQKLEQVAEDIRRPGLKISVPTELIPTSSFVTINSILADGTIQVSPKNKKI